MFVISFLFVILIGYSTVVNGQEPLVTTRAPGTTTVAKDQQSLATDENDDVIKNKNDDAIKNKNDDVTKNTKNSNTRPALPQQPRKSSFLFNMPPFLIGAFSVLVLYGFFHCLYMHCYTEKKVKRIATRAVAKAPTIIINDDPSAGSGKSYS